MGIEYKQAYAAYAKKADAQRPTASQESSKAKRSQETNGTPTKLPPAKRGRTAAKQISTGPEFEADIVAAAEKEGLLASLSNLAQRPEIATQKLPPMRLLNALKDNGGLVS